MKITDILFDLDGTLLPMDQEEFTKSYFNAIAAKTAPHGYEPMTLISTIWKGTAAMVKNDGSMSNEQAFWSSFAETYGDQSLKDIPIFDEFYQSDFQQVRSVCGFQPLAAGLIHDLRERGFRLTLATNPIFPDIATRNRIHWAGLTPDDFVLYTTYENSRFCKPNPRYYMDILSKLGVQPQQCLMVGNDVAEDMIASDLGMQVFLLTDCLINKNNVDISAYPHGDFHALYNFLGAL